MVAYKNNPGHDKDYQRQDYRLPAVITGTRYNPANNDSIDRIVQPSGANELYQKKIEPLRLTHDYYLTQPIWFYEIIKRLAADEVEKKKKEPIIPLRPEHGLNQDNDST